MVVDDSAVVRGFIVRILESDPGIELVATSLPELRAALKKAGMALEKTQWLSEGHDCVDLQIVVASKEDTGDVGEEIEWVITSADFRVK